MIDLAAGICGTLTWPYIRQNFGLDKGSLVSLVCFMICIGTCCYAVFHTKRSSPSGGYVVLAAIILSRPFLWVFDLANVQLFQERIERTSKLNRKITSRDDKTKNTKTDSQCNFCFQSVVELCHILSSKILYFR